MKNNFISILITNYNKDKFLKKTLKQVSNQKFKNYEIILYDDCSNDDSLRIIKSFKKIKLIRNLVRKNTSGPLNQIEGIIKVFKKSKGNIICLLDADDGFLKNKLTQINIFFNKNKYSNCVFNMPQGNYNNFTLKNKNENKHIWPTIFPTSCISMRRKFFQKFIHHIERNKFKDLEIDARITIFSKFFYNEYNIIRQKLTSYNYDAEGITANIQRFSIKWWNRRYQAFSYLKIILKKKKQVFTPHLDYFLTCIFNLFTKIKKNKI